jgi:nickel-dependent lactate racemase
MPAPYYLSLGLERREEFSLPEGWVASHFVEVTETSPVRSIGEMTADAVARPFGAPPLKQLAGSARKVAVIVDDLTRPTPVPPILHVVLPGLERAGVPREAIAIVIAAGTHAPMVRDDLESRLGADVVSGYRVFQHDARGEGLVPVAVPGDPRVVRIHPEVAGADLRVGISSVLPHPMAGYGGGPKILMPGVCDFDTIRDHHMRHLIHPASRASVTRGNPFHEDCMHVARAIGLGFSLNCVYDPLGRVVRILGGSLEMAFAEAVAACRETLGHRFEEPVDVTITSTYPHSHGHQFFKGLSAPDAVTRETGAILLAAPIVAPISRDFLASFQAVVQASGGDPAALVRRTLSQGKAFLPDKSIDFNMAMATVFLRPKIRTLLVSPNIPKEEVELMGMEYAPSLEAGIQGLTRDIPQARVAILPCGGLIEPIRAWEGEL